MSEAVPTPPSDWPPMPEDSPRARVRVANRKDGGYWFWLLRLYGFAACVFVAVAVVAAVSVYGSFANSTPATPNLRTFAVLVTYVPDAVERRAPYREAHLAYARALRDAGHMALGGAFADPVDGALLVYRAESRAQVEAWAERTDGTRICEGTASIGEPSAPSALRARELERFRRASCASSRARSRATSSPSSTRAWSWTPSSAVAP